MRRAALWLWLCALALRLQPAVPQIVATNVPPEDQDSSGDDSDNFSGSGAGSLPDLTLSRHTTPTWSTLGLLSAKPTAPEPTSVDTTVSISSVAEGPVLLEVDPGLTALEKEAGHVPDQPTQHPTTPREGARVRSTAALGTVTSQPHRGTRPVSQETAAPSAPGQHDPEVHYVGDGGPAVTEKVTEEGATSQFPGAEGSGEQDFTFETTGDNTAEAAPELDKRDRSSMGHEATGASQSLLDRKEVLGGVIAGGLVGLIFAVCLVGFMLYRMKKKDEGSYSLEEPKQANGGAYQKPSKQEEFYA
ncbi:syndecan-1 [Sorex fumeus]|uniref:syndecan-1 n=1 Tax=Sorex fumeus TaxID=62283 RepID=UPI0024AD266F|nr:syndecan-1 [Sorex fumeus]